MKKLKLDLTQLRVESFAAELNSVGASTVRAQTNIATCDTVNICATTFECLTAHCNETNAAGGCPTYGYGHTCAAMEGCSATNCGSYQGCTE